MQLYSYVTLNEQGKKVRGKIKAVNEMDLEERLKAIGLDLIDCKFIKEKQSSFFGKVKLQDLVILCVQFEQLEIAGVPILESIADFRDTSESPLMKNIMADIYESVKSGKVLSSAFAQHPKVFDSVFVSLIEAGEKTGNLHEVFHHLSNHLKWVSDMRRRVKKATYYPTFLLILMFGIISLMMLFVIPKLSSFLTAQSFDLPFYTKALIDTSDFFVNYWYYIFGGIISTVVTFKIFQKTSESFRYFLDKLKISLPFIGDTLRKIDLARFCRFFSIMYRSGIDILDCLEISNKVVVNKIIKEHVAFILKDVSDGNSLTNSLKSSGQFPSLVMRMFKVGEDSGNLGSTLENVNYFYDREVDDGISAMIGFIQPTLTIIMGLLMGWVSISVFGPLYSSFSKMNF